VKRQSAYLSHTLNAKEKKEEITSSNPPPLLLVRTNTSYKAQIYLTLSTLQVVISKSGGGFCFAYDRLIFTPLEVRGRKKFEKFFLLLKNKDYFRQPLLIYL